MPHIAVLSHNPLLAVELIEQLGQAGYSAADRVVAQTELVISDGKTPESPGIPVLSLRDELDSPLSLAQLLSCLSTRLRSTERPVALSMGAELLAGRRQLRHSSLDKPLDLTEKEALMLEALAQAAPLGCTREALLSGVWNYGEDIATHTLETHVHRLRGKLEEAGLKNMIETTAQGYRLHHD